MNQTAGEAPASNSKTPARYRPEHRRWTRPVAVAAIGASLLGLMGCGPGRDGNKGTSPDAASTSAPVFPSFKEPESTASTPTEATTPASAETAGMTAKATADADSHDLLDKIYQLYAGPLAGVVQSQPAGGSDMVKTADIPKGDQQYGLTLQSFQGEVAANNVKFMMVNVTSTSPQPGQIPGTPEFSLRIKFASPNEDVQRIDVVSPDTGPNGRTMLIQGDSVVDSQTTQPVGAAQLDGYFKKAAAAVGNLG